MPRSRRRSARRAPHFVDFVKGELAERYGKQMQTEGLLIYTTLDVDQQQAAQRAVTQGLEGLEKTYRRLASAAKEAPLQGALIVLEPQTGSVRALVGGRDYRLSQFNRVTQAHRQPGSLFKPFVYLAAFARRDLDPPITPASIFLDSPITVAWGQLTEDETWTPRNYDGEYRGPMTARQALELSINIPTVRVSLQAGLPYVLAAARRGRDRLAPAGLSVGRARRVRELADGDRRRLRGFRQQRRSRGPQRDRGGHDRRRHGARPQGDRLGARPAGRRRVPRQLDPAGRRQPRHGGRAPARAG